MDLETIAGDLDIDDVIELENSEIFYTACEWSRQLLETEAKIEALEGELKEQRIKLQALYEQESQGDETTIGLFWQLKYHKRDLLLPMVAIENGVTIVFELPAVPFRVRAGIDDDRNNIYKVRCALPITHKVFQCFQTSGGVNAWEFRNSLKFHYIRTDQRL